MIERREVIFISIPAFYSTLTKGGKCDKLQIVAGYETRQSGGAVRALLVRALRIRGRAAPASH
jgi:hypothetical protein